MPLPLTVSCFSKIQIGFTFLVPAHPGIPGKRAVKRVCVCVCVCVFLLPFLSPKQDVWAALLAPSGVRGVAANCNCTVRTAQIRSITAHSMNRTAHQDKPRCMRTVWRHSPARLRSNSSEGGWSILSIFEEAVCCTVAVPTGSPQNFTAIGVSSTSIRLQWDPPPRKHRNGEIVLYEVREREIELFAKYSVQYHNIFYR